MNGVAGREFKRDLLDRGFQPRLYYRTGYYAGNETYKMSCRTPYQVRGRPDPASSLLLVPGFRRDDVWVPAPAPDSDPGFAGMTTLTYIVAGVIMA
jgi:hypothetical protein